MKKKKIYTIYKLLKTDTTLLLIMLCLSIISISSIFLFFNTQRIKVETHLEINIKAQLDQNEFSISSEEFKNIKLRDSQCVTIEFKPNKKIVKAIYRGKSKLGESMFKRVGGIIPSDGNYSAIVIFRSDTLWDLMNGKVVLNKNTN